MSSVFKGIKKIFKKIGKALKKILPAILAVGAIVFTGGAALGLTGTWGAMAATVSSAVGATGAVGAALTGAITQAGYGALIGGTISELSGGSFSKGAKAGAVAGAITGGISGAYGHIKSGVPIKPGQTPGIGDGVQVAGKQSSGVTTYPLGAKVSNTGIAPQTGGGGLFTQGGWLERNQDLVGNVVKGIGSGLVAGGQADAEKDLLRERQRLVAANYAGADPGANYRSAEPGNGLMPSQRFSGSYYGSFEYRYNPETARIERMPVGG